MPVPAPGHFLRHTLSEDDNRRASILSPEALAKLQTMNVELAENIAEFTFEAGNSGVLLNTPDFWQMRGRRSLVLQLLQDHDDATGTSSANLTSAEIVAGLRDERTF